MLSLSGSQPTANIVYINYFLATGFFLVWFGLYNDVCTLMCPPTSRASIRVNLSNATWICTHFERWVQLHFSYLFFSFLLLFLFFFVCSSLLSFIHRSRMKLKSENCTGNRTVDMKWHGGTEIDGNVLLMVNKSRWMSKNNGKKEWTVQAKSWI